MKFRNLAKHVMSFRYALENMPFQELPIGLHKFPHGCCGDATLLLGTYLIQKGYAPFYYMLGKRDNSMDENLSSHAWLEQNGIIVDITSDQFTDGPGKCIVCHDSNWHASFAGMPQHVADYRIFNLRTFAILEAAYKAICFNIKKT